MSKERAAPTTSSFVPGTGVTAPPAGELAGLGAGGGVGALWMVLACGVAGPERVWPHQALWWCGAAAVAGISGGLVAWGLSRARVRRGEARRRSGLCVECGYPGSGEACPECGRRRGETLPPRAGAMERLLKGVGWGVGWGMAGAGAGLLASLLIGVRVQSLPVTAWVPTAPGGEPGSAGRDWVSHQYGLTGRAGWRGVSRASAVSRLGFYPGDAPDPGASPAVTIEVAYGDRVRWVVAGGGGGGRSWRLGRGSGRGCGLGGRWRRARRGGSEGWRSSAGSRARWLEGCGGGEG